MPFLRRPTSCAAAVPLLTRTSVVKWRPVEAVTHICLFYAGRNILQHYIQRSSTNNRPMYLNNFWEDIKKTKIFSKPPLPLKSQRWQGGDE